MEKNSLIYQSYIKILEEELIPAMGCTEPIALAYGASRCRDLLGKIPESVKVYASGSIIKNVKSVVVPNTGGQKGIETAVAAGIIAGVTEKKLEVISEATDEQVQMIRKYLEESEITVEYLDEGFTFDIIVVEKAGDDEAKVRITNHHTNIVYEEKNGKILLENVVKDESEEGLTDRDILNVNDIWEFVTNCDIINIKSLLDKQIVCNMSIAEEGIRNSYGANIGSVMLEMRDDVSNRAAAMAAAASDARMNGCEMPVMINSGSGNQGITCSVPVIVFARELQVEEEQLYRALALSNLIAIYQKTGIGRLSAFCGAVCAGVAAGAGIAYLKGGGLKEICHTVVNGLAIVSGIVCDGAKASCAGKIAFSVNAGILGYEMYKRGQQFRDGDGLVVKGADNTIRNIGRLGKEGMKETNEEIIRIMIGK